MNKWWIIIIGLLIFTGCKKSDDVAAQVNKQAAIDDQLVADYLSANKIPAIKVSAGRLHDTIGVWYLIEEPGSKPASYTSSTTITVGFTGRTLLDQKVFTSTGNIHPSFTLGSVIKGWQLGLEAAKANIGGKVRVIMSSRYAYGPHEQASYNLPANSLLDFDIELFDVKN